MLEEHGILQNYKAGDIVFKEGDRGRDMYVVRSGCIKILRSGHGKEVILAIIEQDDFFGEMALFGANSRSATAMAEEDSELLIVSNEAFMSFIKEPVVWNVLQRLSSRIREVDDKIEELSVQDQIRKEHLGSLIAHRRTF